MNPRCAEDSFGRDCVGIYIFFRSCQATYQGVVNFTRRKFLALTAVESAIPDEQRYFTEMCRGSEEGSYVRLADTCVSLNSRLESNKEEERRRW